MRASFNEKLFSEGEENLNLAISSFHSLASNIVGVYNSALRCELLDYVNSIIDTLEGEIFDKINNSSGMFPYYRDIAVKLNLTDDSSHINVDMDPSLLKALNGFDVIERLRQYYPFAVSYWDYRFLGDRLDELKALNDIGINAENPNDEYYSILERIQQVLPKLPKLPNIVYDDNLTSSEIWEQYSQIEAYALNGIVGISDRDQALTIIEEIFPHFSEYRVTNIDSNFIDDNKTFGINGSTFSYDRLYSGTIDIIGIGNDVILGGIPIIKETIAKFPKNAIDLLDDTSFLLCDTNYSYEKQPQWAGFFAPRDYSGNEFIALDMSLCSPDLVSHECGHAVDSRLGDVIGNRPSDTEKWRRLCNTEVVGLGSITCPNIPSDQLDRSNSTEFFAGAFDAYVNNPKELKKMCPKTYNTLEKLISSIPHLSLGQK